MAETTRRSLPSVQSIPAGDSKPVKSAARVLDILELFGRTDGALTLSEVATALELPKSSTYLLLQTLVQRGYLDALSGSGPFQLGLKVVELAGAYTRRADLVRQFPAVARPLVAACQETVQLAILDGMEVVYLAKEDGTRPVRLVSSVGQRLPAHATALGKALLAGLADEELAARLAGARLAPLTPRTIVSARRLRDELARVRRDGHALDDEETLEGLCCVAAPVRGPGGQVVAAMSISAPKSRLSESEVSRLAKLIRRAAADLSRRIGYA